MAQKREICSTAARPLLPSVLPVVILLILSVAAANARRVRMPLPVRIIAYVNAKPDGVNSDYEWVVADRDVQIRLYIQRLFVRTPDVSASKLSSAVEPYPVQFQLAGSQKDALDHLKTAPAGARVVIEAYVEVGGARVMMLETVDVAPEATKDATP